MIDLLVHLFWNVFGWICAFLIFWAFCAFFSSGRGYYPSRSRVPVAPFSFFLAAIITALAILKMCTS
jgi:hypothetical protein